MADESKLSKFKHRVTNVDLTAAKQKGTLFVNLVKRFIVAIAVIAAFAGGLFIGARMHELGHLESIKGLKGATVTVSGPCLVEGVTRVPSLAEDEVKVTSVENGRLSGVVRLTREVVDCEISKIAIDKLPLLSNIGKSPAVVPEIKEMERRSADIPQYKLLENKVLLVSGTCAHQLDKKEIPPFTDEKIDVTSVEVSKENPAVFSIAGIRRSDKVALVCSSRAIKYRITDSSEPIAIEPEKLPTTFIKKIITVTSKCVPDSRLPVPRGPDGRKVAFFRLVNSPVQVLEEVIVNDRLVKFTGTIVDKKIAAAFGQMVVCDASVFPMTYAPLDEEDTMLDRVDSQKNNPDALTGSKIMMEEPAEVVKPTPAPRVAPKRAATPAPTLSPLTAPAEVFKTAPAESATPQPAAPAASPEQSKEDLLKQLDGGETNGQ